VAILAAGRGQNFIDLQEGLAGSGYVRFENIMTARHCIQFRSNQENENTVDRKACAAKVGIGGVHDFGS
jgi:hypothetical protein